MAWQCYWMRSFGNLWLEWTGRWRQGSNGRQRRRGWERSNRGARQAFPGFGFEFRAGINGYRSNRRKGWFGSYRVARFGFLGLTYFRIGSSFLGSRLIDGLV